MSAEARREQLLDAAKAVVADKGFHGVSIEAVARGAGVTRPIIYRHFHDLGAMLDALIERETLRALMQLREVLPAGVDDLIAAFEGYLRAVRSDPVTWRLVLVTPEGASGSPPAAHKWSRSSPRRLALGPGHPIPSSQRTRFPPWPTRPRGSRSPIPRRSRRSG
jgi:AcrR family transcriptional regulator